MGLRLGNTHNYKNRIKEKFGVKNAKRIFALDIGGVMTDLLIRLGGSLVITGGTGNGTSIGENPAGLIQSIKLVAKSRGAVPGGELVDLTPRSIIRSSVFDDGRAIVDTALTGAAGTFTLDQALLLHFAQPRAPRPFDFALDTDPYKSLVLEILNGSETTQFSGNDRTFNFDALTYEVSDYRETVTDRKPKPILYQSDDELVIDAANARLKYDDFPIGYRMFALLLMAESGTAKTLVDTIINKVTLNYGEDFYEAFEEEIKHLQKKLITDAAQGDTGLYLAQFNKDQLAYGAVPNFEARDFTAEFDVSNPGGAGADKVVLVNKRVLLPEDYARAA